MLNLSVILLNSLRVVELCEHKVTRPGIDIIRADDNHLSSAIFSMLHMKELLAP